jgi:hypothetical protein
VGQDIVMSSQGQSRVSTLYRRKANQDPMDLETPSATVAVTGIDISSLAKGFGDAINIDPMTGHNQSLVCVMPIMKRWQHLA